jgi:hypothetical protein
MAQANDLKPFDFNRNTQAFISRLVRALSTTNTADHYLPSH